MDKSKQTQSLATRVLPATNAAAMASATTLVDRSGEKNLPKDSLESIRNGMTSSKDASPRRWRSDKKLLRSFKKTSSTPKPPNPSNRPAPTVAQPASPSSVAPTWHMAVLSSSKLYG
ncbi:hypothetical protein NKR23_g11443 [Pleurostoma richardsiae]|uniref:Uncharacterized protein n=1 Tax=Pleurostoma richardsiae TaxID=41990 RepID=A0AA38RAK7_9PEZI|nr:hypothetical protein NKR23_g11443 [Pleurostoma richardsiae]